MGETVEPSSGLRGGENQRVHGRPDDIRQADGALRHAHQNGTGVAHGQSVRQVDVSDQNSVRVAATRVGRN